MEDEAVPQGPGRRVVAHQVVDDALPRVPTLPTLLRPWLPLRR